MRQVPRVIVGFGKEMCSSWLDTDNQQVERHTAMRLVENLTVNQYV